MKIKHFEDYKGRGIVHPRSNRNVQKYGKDIELTHRSN